MKFKVKAIDPKGKNLELEVEADTMKSAIGSVRIKGFTVIDAVEMGDKKIVRENKGKEPTRQSKKTIPSKQSRRSGNSFSLPDIQCSMMGREVGESECCCHVNAWKCRA